MTNIVVTGSTRGIGRAIAEELIALGHRVVISGRDPALVGRAAAELAAKGPGSAVGIACNLEDRAAIEALWSKARESLGSIDIWVNNAGQAHETHKFWDQAPERIDGVIGTNLLGVMHASQIVVRGMLEQGHGALYNLTGFGRTGIHQDGMLIYGTSKRAVDYFSRSLAQELKGTKVIVGQINPGMIVTDMLREGYRSSVRKPSVVEWTYNAVGDLPEDAARFIVPRMLANRDNGVLINRQPRWVVATRFLRAALFGPRRKVFSP